MLITSPPVLALGLGELSVRSPLGAPLQAEVSIIADADEDIGSQCFRIGPPRGDDDLPWLRGLRLQVRDHRLLITSRDPVDYPVAMLAVQVQCGLQLRRDYTLLLQPPVAGWTPAPLPRETAAPMAASAPPQRRAQPRPSPMPPATTPAPARAPSADTRQMPPAPSPRIHPETEPLAQKAPRAGDKLEVRQQAPTPAADGRNAPATPPLTHEQAVLAAIEDRITLQHELNEKLDRLERYQIELRKQLDEMDQRSQALPPPASHREHPAPVVVEASTPQLGAWALGGLALAGLGAAGFLLLRRHYDNKAYSALTHAIDTSRMSPQDAHHQVATPKSTASAIAAPELAHMPDLPGQTVEWHDPTDMEAPLNSTPDGNEEQDSALELAEIMLSFGRTQGAAEALAEYIRNNPRQAVKPWMKLLEVYHFAGMQAEYEALSRQLNKTFNVKVVNWQDFPAARNDPQGLEQLPHITERLTAYWRTREAQAYIHQLLRDNRNGARQGFPHAVVEDLLMLQGVLNLQLGPYKPPRETGGDLIITQSGDTLNIHLDAA